MLMALLVVLLLLVAALLVLGRRRDGRLELPRRKRDRILPGGGAVPDDLSKDASTDEQRFLM